MKNKSKNRVSCQVWHSTNVLILQAQKKYKAKTGVDISKAAVTHELIKSGSKNWKPGRK